MQKKMTVAELATRLKDLPQNAVVLTAGMDECGMATPVVSLVRAREVGKSFATGAWAEIPEVGDVHDADFEAIVIDLNPHENFSW